MLNYTTEQKSFLDSSGKVVLVACPGSGKTAVVAQKMVNYLQHWNRPHQGVAVLTFTNVAINEIKRQAKEILPEGLFIDTPHFIGTIDSFINNYIALRFGYLLLKSPQRPIITFTNSNSSTVSSNFVKSYRFWEKQCYQNCLLDLKKISGISLDSNENLTPKLNNETCPVGGQNDRPCIQFKKQMLKKGLFFQEEVADLSSILLEKYPEVAKSVVSRFPIIILDEAQDSSKEQMQIIDLLCAAGLESVYLIGDPDQSIYEWRNANPESLLGKMNDPNWTHLYLTKNFRSSQLICDATHVFSNTYKEKANEAKGVNADYKKKPTLFLYEKNTPEDSIIQKFKEECEACGITLTPDKVAIVTRKRVHTDSCVNNLWKTLEIELLAQASFERLLGNTNKAYSCCERALFQMIIKELKEIDVSIEHEVSKIMPYKQWKEIVIEILINLPSANEQCDLWVARCQEIMKKILDTLLKTLHKNVSIEKKICIKSRDKKNSEFKKTPIKYYFETKSQTEYTRSSIHAVKGETFDALLLFIPTNRGNTLTLTPTTLTKENTNTELLRIAYVAMTRPRKLLVIAMPKSEVDLSNRFPKEKWDYVEL